MVSNLNTVKLPKTRINDAVQRLSVDSINKSSKNREILRDRYYPTTKSPVMTNEEMSTHIARLYTAALDKKASNRICNSTSKNIISPYEVNGLVNRLYNESIEHRLGTISKLTEKYEV